MRKIINNPEHVVDEMMEGYISAYGRYYVKHPDVNGVILKQRRKDKVALVIGGGSGHEPMFSGFVGKGLADAAACGNIFASPDPNTIYQTAKAVEQGKGVLFVYGCYAGDNLNFDMGEEFLNDDGIQTAHVRVWDDVASAPQERIEDRRGIAGDVFVVKIAGAACDAGLELEEVVRVTEKARDNTRTIGVATAPAQLPGVEQPIFTLGEGEIEYGMGLHGERGVLRTTWEDADVLTEKMYKQILDDSDLKTGDEVCVLVNGLGSTTITELAIVFRKVKKLLDADGIKVYDTDLNNYCTSQEMGGFSITLFKLDEELKKYYDMPCYCPYYAKGELTGNTGEAAGGQTEDVQIKSEPEFDVNDVEAAEIVRSKAGILEELNAADARNMLLYIADKIIAKKPYLTEVDSPLVMETMESVWRAVCRKLRKNSPTWRMKRMSMHSSRRQERQCSCQWAAHPVLFSEACILPVPKAWKRRRLSVQKNWRIWKRKALQQSRREAKRKSVIRRWWMHLLRQ